MEKVALNWKRLGGHALYGGLLAAPVAYIGLKGRGALQAAQADKPPPVSGKSREYRKHVGKGMGLSEEEAEQEKKRYRKYFEQLRQAPHIEPGETVVTASATDFIEKRAALQEGHTKEAVGLLKRIFTQAGRQAHRAEQVAAKAQQAAQQVSAVQQAAEAAGVPAQAVQSMMPAAAAPAEKSFLSHMLGPKGLVVGGSLVGLGALGEPLLQRYGFEARESRYPGLAGLPERVRMDELAAESFANAVGKELGTSTVGLVGDVLSKSLALPGDLMRGQQRRSVFDELRQEDDVIAKADPGALNEAYHTMVRFAPTLATDKNAVKTFLRESTLYGTGPNFMAIKQLADAESAVTRPDQFPRR